MTTALVAANVSSAPASWDVGRARGPDSTEIHRFAGFLERALIDVEPSPDRRTGSSDHIHNGREADEKIRKDAEFGARENQKSDRSDETDTRAAERKTAAARKAEAAGDSDARHAAERKTTGNEPSDRRNPNGEDVANKLGNKTGMATKEAKAIQHASVGGNAVADAEVKKSIADDDDESSRAGVAGVQEQLEPKEARNARIEEKLGGGEAESRHAATNIDAGQKERPVGDESDRSDAKNGQTSDQGRTGGDQAIDRADTVRSERGDLADKADDGGDREDPEDRGKKRGVEKSERVGSRDRDGEPRVKVIDTRRAERLDPVASREASGSADENRTSSEAPGIEIRNQGGNEPVNARNPVRYAEASAELARSLRESANAEIVREARIILRTENSGEIRLVLRPEELGNVRIRLQMQDNHIAGRILVENSSIREIFAQNMDDLARAFAEAGIELGSMEVSVGDGERSDADDRPRSDGPQRVAGEFERNTHAVVYYGFEDTRVNVFA